MGDRSLYRYGAIAAIAGTLLGGITNLLHPHIINPDDSSVRELIQSIADDSAWNALHLLQALSILLMMGGMVAYYRALQAAGPEAASALARMGYATALLATAVGIVGLGMDAYAMKEVADAWASASAEDESQMFLVARSLQQSIFGIFSIWLIAFFGLALILFGIATIMSTTFPNWLGWLAIVSGIGNVVVGVLQSESGPSPFASELLFMVFSTLAGIWLVIVGVLLWRRSNVVDPDASRVMSGTSSG